MVHYSSPAWRDALWDKFFTGVPRRRRQSVEQYKIVRESLRALANRHGINQKTVAKWKNRATAYENLKTGPKEPKSTVLTVEDEAIVRSYP